MSTADKLARLGVWPEEAVAVSAGDWSAGAVAAGTTQATAAPLVSDITKFATVAASSGCLLRAVPGRQVVFNGGANALAVYPPVGGTINAGAADAAFAVAAAKSAMFLSTDGLNFVAVLSA